MANRYNNALLDVHVQRAVSGPYRVAGDASTNSPGLWARSLANAISLFQSPTSELTTSAFALGYNTEPKTMKKTLDAAYVAFLMNYAASKSTPVTIPATHTAAQYISAVKTVLLAQIAKPETDFSKFELFGDRAGWRLAGWVIKMLGAYDWVYDSFSTGEKTALNAWFYNAANFYARNQQNDLSKQFPKRLVNDYTPRPNSDAATAELIPATAVDEGWAYTHVTAAGVKTNRIPKIGKWYNNRRAAQAAAIAEIDRFFKRRSISVANVKGTGADNVAYDAPLDAFPKAYFKEWVKYGVFPDGMQTEYERSIPTGPNKGFNYAGDNLDLMVIIAGLYPELYDYETSDGIAGTKGGDKKGLKKALDTYIRICSGNYEYYYMSVTAGNRYKLQQLSDGKTTNYVSDTRFIEANLYYQSTYVKGVYTRNPATFNTAYPSGSSTQLIGSIAGLSPWASIEEIRPAGNLFLFGQLEGVVDPYSVTKTKQTINFQKPTNKVFGDAPFALVATAGSGLAVTYSIVSGPATIAGSTVTITGAGTVVVRAEQAGNGTYEAAPSVDYSIAVEKAAQTITFPEITDKQIAVSSPFSLAATASSGGQIDYEIVEGTGSINAATGVFTLGGVGTVTVVARQAGTANTKPAEARRTFTVQAAPPPVVTNILAGKAYTKSKYTPLVPAGSFTDGLENNISGVTEFYAVWTAATIELPKTLTKIVIKMNGPIANFKVQQSLGGGNWEDIVSVTGNTEKVRAFVVDKAVTGDIRLVGIGKGLDYNLNEIEIFAY